MSQLPVPADVQRVISIAAFLRESGFQDHADIMVDNLIDTVLASPQPEPAPAVAAACASAEPEPEELDESASPAWVPSIRDWRALCIPRTSDTDIERLIRGLVSTGKLSGQFTSYEIRAKVEQEMYDSWQPGDLIHIAPTPEDVGTANAVGIAWSYTIGIVLRRLVQTGELVKVSRFIYSKPSRLTSPEERLEELLRDITQENLAT